MKNIILHPGMFKAGSTLIQKIIENNEQALRNEFAIWSHVHTSKDFLFFDEEVSLFESEVYEAGGHIDGANQMRARTARGAPTWARALGRYLTYKSPLPTKVLQRLSDKFQAAMVALPQDNLIISSEFFAFTQLSSYGPKTNFHNAMLDLAKIMDPFSVSVHIILRNQKDLIFSLYNQIIKGNFISHEYGNWVELHSKYLEQGLNYDEMEAIISGIFGKKIKLYLFEDIKSDLIDKFFAPVIAGCSSRLDLSFRDDWKNQSLSPTALEIVRHANGLLTSEAQRQIILEAAQHLSRMQGDDGVGVVTPALPAALMESFGLGNMRLAERWTDLFVKPSRRSAYLPLVTP